MRAAIVAGSVLSSAPSAPSASRAALRVASSAARSARAASLSAPTCLPRPLFAFLSVLSCLLSSFFSISALARSSPRIDSTSCAIFSSSSSFSFEADAASSACAFSKSFFACFFSALSFLYSSFAAASSRLELGDLRAQLRALGRDRLGRRARAVGERRVRRLERGQLVARRRELGARGRELALGRGRALSAAAAGAVAVRGGGRRRRRRVGRGGRRRGRRRDRRRRRTRRRHRRRRSPRRRHRRRRRTRRGAPGDAAAASAFAAFFLALVASRFA